MIRNERPADAAQGISNTRGMTGWLAKLAALLGRRPPALQVAALVLRGDPGAEEVLLITSRGTGRWVLPKGWPMKGKSLAGAAQREAWEEAGATGAIGRDAVGSYGYLKIGKGGSGQRVVVSVFAMRLRRLEPDFPEKGQRELGWFAPEVAAGLVAEPELATLLTNLRSQLARA